jgi:hypothetical protein
MLSPFRPAVFACPMRYVHTEKPKKVWPPPSPAWPEIAHPSGYYTLPTLASHPAINLCIWWPREYCAPRAESCFKVDAPLGIADPEWDEFAFLHEAGHYFSFGTIRPTILEVNRIASGIFALIKKLSLTGLLACENFWDEFQEGNKRLVNYLEKALILEELRASLFAFSLLDPNIRVSIEPDLRKVMNKEDAISYFGRPMLRTDLFDKLTRVTNEDWLAAFDLSILADYIPKDPLKRLHFLCNRGVDAGSQMLLDEASERVYQAGWEVEIIDPMYGKPKIGFSPGKEYAVSTVQHLSLSDVREMVFLESLRQQLAQFSGVSLVCPFQQKGRTCCGFGHYLRAVWEQVRPEHRSAKAVLNPKTGKEIVVRPPRTVCLHYGLG